MNQSTAPKIDHVTLAVLQNGLNLLAVQAYYQQLAIGLVLILAVSFESVQFRRRR